MSLTTLPPELYLAILSHIPSADLQTSTLNLSKAIPLSPVPLRPIFEHISISLQQQLPQLYRRLKSPPRIAKNSENRVIAEECTWVRSFSLVTWQADADILVDVLALLPLLEDLSLMIGPTFAPEHLQDMFTKPMLSLNILSLRFRPYVKTATYYQFLKASYFDSMLDLISDWPADSSLTHISIIQDPLPPLPAGSTHKSFAQPIVFFSLAPLTSLSFSPATRKVTHLRIRIPSRQLVRFIASSSPSGSDVRYPFPQTIYLDLSTCLVPDPVDVETLLNHVGGGRLKYLLLENTGLCDTTGGEWERLGRTCAIAGVRRSRDCEKVLKSWTLAQSIANDGGQGNMDNNAHGNAQQRRPRRGRRGLATATISLRESPTNAPSLIPTPQPSSQVGHPHRSTKIRIFPPPPRLASLCVNLRRTSGPHVPEDLPRAQFVKGWSDGVSQLRSMWARLRHSKMNGTIRVFRFNLEDQNAHGEDAGMLAGLVEMTDPESDEQWQGGDGSLEPPCLCLSGPRGEAWENDAADDWSGHPKECGHRVSWNIWADNL